MTNTRKLLIVVCVMGLCIFLDQATKLLAARYLSAAVSIPVCQGLVRFEYAENSGMFSSLGAEWPAGVRFWLFTVGVSLILTLLFSLLLIARRSARTFLVGGALVIGGGLSNLLDRLLNQGAVIDFVLLVIGSWISDIFNLADLAISVGLFMMLLSPLGKFQKRG